MFIGREIIILFSALFAKGANGTLSEYLDDLKNNMEKIAEHVKKVKWLNRLDMVRYDFLNLSHPILKLVKSPCVAINSPL